MVRLHTPEPYLSQLDKVVLDRVLVMYTHEWPALMPSLGALATAISIALSKSNLLTSDAENELFQFDVCQHIQWSQRSNRE